MTAIICFFIVFYLFYFFHLSKGEDQWIFDLQSLATLAAARALELGSQDSGTTDAEMQYPARRTLNLRRKCSWTPRHEPVTHPCFVLLQFIIYVVIYVICILFVTNPHPTLLYSISLVLFVSQGL